MANTNNNSAVAGMSTSSVDNSQHSALKIDRNTLLTVYPPFRYLGGDLGLGNKGEPWIHIADSRDQMFYTHSVEWLLRHIELFVPGRNQTQPLACAAAHFGLEPFALYGAPMPDRYSEPVEHPVDEPRWDLFDADKRLLLSGVTHHAAWLACEQLKCLPGWGGKVVTYRRQRDGETTNALLWDWRHEGSLALLYHHIGHWDCNIVAVRSHVGRCGMMLEEVPRRLDQFSLADQRQLLAALNQHFDMNQKPTSTGEAA